MLQKIERYSNSKVLKLICKLLILIFSFYIFFQTNITLLLAEPEESVYFRNFYYIVDYLRNPEIAQLIKELASHGRDTSLLDFEEMAKDSDTIEALQEKLDEYFRASRKVFLEKEKALTRYSRIIKCLTTYINYAYKYATYGVVLLSVFYVLLCIIL